MATQIKAIKPGIRVPGPLKAIILYTLDYYSIYTGHYISTIIHYYTIYTVHPGQVQVWLYHYIVHTLPSPGVTSNTATPADQLLDQLDQLISC